MGIGLGDEARIGDVFGCERVSCDFFAFFRLYGVCSFVRAEGLPGFGISPVQDVISFVSGWSSVNSCISEWGWRSWWMIPLLAISLV
jgi:hypothetical protein